MAGPINPTVLTFTAPQLNTDATPLTDLSCYRVFIGQSPAGPWTQVATATAAQADPPAGATVTMSGVPGWWQGMAPGQYYLTVDALDVLNNPSNKATPVPFGVGDVVAPSPPTNLVLA